MWEISSNEQYLCFIYSMCLGAFLGLIYDFFKIDRNVFKRRKLTVVFQDILFWIISAFMFFSFSIVFSNGQIRAYLLLGSFLGFLIYRMTLSKILILIIVPFKKINFIIKKQYLKLLEKLNLCIVKLICSFKKNFC